MSVVGVSYHIDEQSSMFGRHAVFARIRACEDVRQLVEPLVCMGNWVFSFQDVLRILMKRASTHDWI